MADRPGRSWVSSVLPVLTDCVGSFLGGPAGCVVAGRLARADDKLEVMLVEGGANNIDGQHDQPPLSWIVLCC